MTKPLSPSELDRLRKIRALFDSSNEGERRAAQDRASSLLKAHDLTLDDIPSVLDEKPVVAPTAGNAFSDIFSRVDDAMEAREPGYKARKAAEQAARAKANEEFRRAVRAKYSSAEAAKKPNAMELAIQKAVKRFRRKVSRKMNIRYPDGTLRVEDHEEDSLDGWTGPFDEGELPSRVADAIRAALPMPTTITAAKAEYDAWQERDDELNAAWGNDRGSNTELSLECAAREDMMRDLVLHELRAQSAAEVLIRLKKIADEQRHAYEEETAAMLADLEYLAEREVAQPVVASKPAKKRQANATQPDFGF